MKDSMVETRLKKVSMASTTASDIIYCVESGLFTSSDDYVRYAVRNLTFDYLLKGPSDVQTAYREYETLGNVFSERIPVDVELPIGLVRKIETILTVNGWNWDSFIGTAVYVMNFDLGDNGIVGIEY